MQPPAPVAAALSVARIETHVLRCPIETPVRTSFGVMHDRPALLVRVEGADGAHGWGEVWCNFPACGAEHRARLVDSVLAPQLVGRRFDAPTQAFAQLEAATRVLALQSGEPGPLAQAIAGVDQALWDLVARRAGLPLWRLLGGGGDEIGVYASGINPDAPDAVVRRMHAQGHRAFKLKVGFGDEIDAANLQRVRDAAGDGAVVMVDANQAWDLAGALRMAERLAPLRPAWIEEPLAADRPWSEWHALRERSGATLAAGENVIGATGFDALLASGAVGVVQPDVAKWGGLSGCRALAERIGAHGLRYCPHYLGGGIGLLHSAHLLAAAGGDGLLEIDANDNPLRSLLCGALGSVREGRARLGTRPGIGIEPDLRALREACAH